MSIIPSIIVSSVDVVESDVPTTAYPIVEVADYCADMNSLLLEQFKHKDRIEALLCSYATQLQEIETQIFRLLTLRNIDDSEGLQLDGIGEIIGRARAGLSDEDYRARLRIQILVNTASGTIEDVVSIIRLLAPDIATPIRLVEGDVAEFNLWIDEAITSSLADSILLLLNELRGAGIKANLHYWTTATPFVFFGATGGGFGVGELGSEKD